MAYGDPIPVTIVGGGEGGGAVSLAEAGVSIDGVAVPTSAGGAAIIAAGALSGWATIQNTSPGAQVVYISFNTPTSSSFSLQPGTAITLNFGPTNTLYAIASDVGATIAAVGFASSSNSKTGISIDGVTVNTTAGVVVAAGTFSGWVTLKNDSTGGQIIYLSFGTPTNASFVLKPMSAVTLAFGPTNALNAIASASGAKLSAIGF